MRLRFSAWIVLLAALIGCYYLWAAQNRQCGEVALGIIPSRCDVSFLLEGARLSPGRFFEKPYAPIGAARKLTDVQIREYRDDLIRMGTETTRGISDLVVWDLAIGEPQRAKKRLKEALARNPNNPLLLSDLSAIMLAQHENSADPRDLVVALTLADQAVQLAPAMAEAQFNLALSLEKLSLLRQADQAWSQYVDIDGSDNGWKREASNRLRALRHIHGSQIRAVVGLEDAERILRYVQDFPQYAREYSEEHLLPAWATAQLEGESLHAERILALMRKIGQQLERSNGEAMIRDIVESIDKATQKSRSSPILVQGLLRYEKGMERFKAGDFDAAVAEFASAYQMLEMVDSPIQFWAKYYESICRYQHYHYGKALVGLTSLLHVATSRRYDALLGRSLRLIGLIYIIQGNPDRAVQFASQSLDVFSKSREVANEARAHALLASCYRFLGDDRKTWEHLVEALRGAQVMRNPIQIGSALQVGALAALRSDHVPAALRFQEEAILEAEQAKDPLLLSGTLRWRAALHRLKGDAAKALVDLGEAERAVATIPDIRVRNTIMGDVYLIRGGIEADLDNEGAINTLTFAADTYKATGYRFLLVEALAERGRQYAKMGMYIEAERDYANAIKEFEGQRSLVADDQDRVSFFGRGNNLFEDMVRLQVEQRKRFDLGFDFAERSKARLLLDWVRQSPNRSLDDSARVVPVVSNDLMRDLPSDVALVEYKVLRDHILVWLVQRGNMICRTLPVSRDSLEELASNFLAAIKTGEEESAGVFSEKLYDVLVAPIEDQIPEGRFVVIVPDDPLYKVPFAALRNRRTNRYMVEDHVLAIEPSATLYLHSLRYGRKARIASRASVLVFSNPEIKGGGTDKFTRLLGPQRESEMIARLFPQVKRVEQSQATKKAFLENAGEHDIVHFGGHAVANEEFPLYSRLIVSPENPHDDSDSLYSWEFLRADFTRTRLVVLAACRSALGDVNGSAEMLSLSSPLLAAGIPNVIGSMWDVSDKASSNFFEDFYKRLHHGKDAATAFRDTQVSMLRHRDRSVRAYRSWAAFILLGVVPEGTATTNSND